MPVLTENYNVAFDIIRYFYTSIIGNIRKDTIILIFCLIISMKLYLKENCRGILAHPREYITQYTPAFFLEYTPLGLTEYICAVHQSYSSGTTLLSLCSSFYMYFVTCIN